MTQNDFAFRIDRWTDDGERIVEHVAGAEDFQIAMATYHAARKRWPKAAMTLRQDTWVIEDSRRTRIGTLFSFPWSEKGREGGGCTRRAVKRTALRRASTGSQAGRSGEGASVEPLEEGPLQDTSARPLRSSSLPRMRSANV